MLKDLSHLRKIEHVRKNEITHSQKRKVPTNKPNPLHFSQWHKVPKRKGLSSIKVNLIGIKKHFQKGKEDNGSQKDFLERK